MEVYMFNTFGVFDLTKNVVDPNNIAIFKERFEKSTDKSNEQKLYNEFNNVFKIYNLALCTLGYIPFVSMISGFVRIAGALCITYALLGPQNEMGFNETVQEKVLFVAMAQIGRGFLEAFVPFGKICNLLLDIGSTVYVLHQGKELV